MMNIKYCQVGGLIVLLAIIVTRETFGQSEEPPDAGGTPPGEEGTVTTSTSSLEALVKDFQSVLPSGNSNTSGFSEILEPFRDRIHAIVPGTEWCGAGNIADNSEDLGFFNNTDSCCRTHDQCPSNIVAGKTFGRLKNNGIFTRSWCKCDNDFYQCLKNADNVLASAIGDTYFNVLRPQCFDKYYPITSCAEYSGFIIKGRCLQYNFDTSSQKELEWFDNQKF